MLFNVVIVLESENSVLPKFDFKVISFYQDEPFIEYIVYRLTYTHPHSEYYLS